MSCQEWLTFMPQLPSSPSSLRVAVWRKLKESGAALLQNGVWALPRSERNERFLQELLADVAPAGGRGLIFVAVPLDPAEQGAMLDRFRTDRDHEYGEFSEQCRAFLAEVERETAREKFTFPELEELDEDLNKLSGWLRKIQNRDFFSAPAGAEAAATLQRCMSEFEAFTVQVYAREGVSGSLD